MTMEHRSAIKFCVSNGVLRKDTIQMLEKAYEIRAMKTSQVTSGMDVLTTVKKASTMNHGTVDQRQESHLTSQKSENCLSLTAALRISKSITKLIAAATFYTINLI